MDMSFYTAEVGAAQQQKRLDVVANNIANINTYGFKEEKVSFSSLMNRKVIGIDKEELPCGSGAKIAQTKTDFTGGAVQTTNRAQDYAINGDGFFALIDPSTGEVSYTRDGSFTVSQFQKQENGTLKDVYYLSDGEGRFVVSNEGGMIEVTDTKAKQPVGVFDFINTDGMTHIGDNRFVPTEKNGQVRAGTGTVRQGMLEASNTDLSEEIAKIIEAQRSYSYALKMVQTSDEIESTVNGLRG